MYHDLNITTEEKTTLRNAVSWVTLLIAAADGSIEEEELAWAEKITKIRGYNNPDKLSDFYDEVGKDFSEVLQAEIAALPTGQDAIKAHLSAKIETLNPILAKMDKAAAFHYYKSYVTLAEHVAKSTGGFLRFFSVSVEEKKLMGLPMLQKIVYVEEES